MDNRIIQYYKLNGISMPQANIFSCINEKILTSTLGEPKKFILQANGTYRIKENIIGGAEKKIIVV